MMADVGALLAWVLVVFGTTLIVTQSLIFEPLRRRLAERSYWLGKLASCPMCFGFWAGLMWALVGVPLPFAEHLVAFQSAIASSAVCWMIHVTLERLGASSL